MHVTIWNEFIHEGVDDAVRAVYPDGIHEALRQGLASQLPSAQFSTATLAQPEHGLSEAVLQSTDVLLWWGHLAHHKVSNDVAARVVARVQQGMGLIVLHSAHLSKPFVTLMGTTCNLRWREADDRELVWTVNANHPIVRGVEQPIQIERHEMYGELFDIPAPDDLVFISSFSGGEVFRSGCCFNRGKGRIFYFSPGHETYPIYYQPQILKVIANAVQWVHTSELSSIETSRSPNAPTGWFEK